MSGAGWRLEWRLHRARPRRLAWSVGIPLALLVPVAASGAAPEHRAAVYVVLVVFFGLFGGTVPLIREGERGWIERVVLTGYGARRWMLERAAAHAVQDALQLAPALACVLWLEGAAARPGWVAAAAGALLAAVAAANLLGTLAAAAVRSIAEAALFCSTLGLVAVHLAGTFRAPAAGWSSAAAATNPFRPLVLTMRGMTSTGPSEATGAVEAVSAAPEASVWLAAGAATAALTAGVWALAPAIVGRLTGRGGTL